MFEAHSQDIQETPSPDAEIGQKNAFPTYQEQVEGFVAMGVPEDIAQLEATKHALHSLQREAQHIGVRPESPHAQALSEILETLSSKTEQTEIAERFIDNPQLLAEMESHIGEMEQSEAERMTALYEEIYIQRYGQAPEAYVLLDMVGHNHRIQSLNRYILEKLEIAYKQGSIADVQASPDIMFALLNMEQSRAFLEMHDQAFQETVTVQEAHEEMIAQAENHGEKRMFEKVVTWFQKIASAKLEEQGRSAVRNMIKKGLETLTTHGVQFATSVLTGLL